MWHLPSGARLRARLDECARVPPELQSFQTWSTTAFGMCLLSHAGRRFAPGQAGTIASRRGTLCPRPRAKLPELSRWETVVRRRSGVQGLQALPYVYGFQNADVDRIALVPIWSEQSRYQIGKSEQEVEDFQSAVVGNEGVFTWLRKYW